MCALPEIESRQANCHKRLSAEQFVAMLVSRRRLARFDKRGSGLRGVRDLDTGELFEVEERKLASIEVCADRTR